MHVAVRLQMTAKRTAFLVCLAGGCLLLLWRNEAELHDRSTMELGLLPEAPEITLCDKFNETSWSRGDRSRITKCWHSRVNGEYSGGGISDYDPFEWPVDMATCKAICDGVAECKKIVFTCDNWCHLKNRTAKWSRQTNILTCKRFLLKNSPTHSGTRDPPRLSADGIQNLVDPVPMLRPNAVAVLRCHEGLPWLQSLAHKIEETIGPVQVIVYERCVKPDPASKKFGSIPVLRITAPLGFTSSSFSIAHLLATWKMDRGGKFQQTIFVDARMSSVEARVATDPSTWVYWNDGEWAEHILLTSGFSGVHVVERSKNLNTRRKRYTDWTLRALNWQGPAQIPEPAIQRCPDAAQVRSGALTKRAIVAFLGNASEPTAARVLIHSIRQQGSRTPIIVATTEISSQSGEELLWEFPDISVREWSQPGKWVDTTRHAELNVFNMVDYDEVLFIDASVDIIALDNLDHMFADRVVVNSSSRMLAAPDWGRWATTPSEKLNSGVLIVRPSTELFLCMLQVLNSLQKPQWSCLESESQGFLRLFFGGKAVGLPFLYNTENTLEKYIGHLWFKQKHLALLRFAGATPHETWSTPRFLREFRSESVKEALAKAGKDYDQDDMFNTLSAKWKQSFYTLANFSDIMTIFGLFLDRVSFDVLRRRANDQSQPKNMDVMALTNALDPNPFVPSGVSAQRGMSDRLVFEGLMATSRLPWYDKPWIGFTTEAESEELREGATVDWVKADRAMSLSGTRGRTILFWYGLFAGDYWEMMEKHHKGMQVAFLAVLRQMGISSQRMTMPRNSVWPFGHNIILPTELLREFVSFAEKFMNLFTMTYSRTCPFDTPVPLQGASANGCIGYATERIIHVWAVLAKVNLKYVVDDPQLRYVAPCNADVVHCRKPS
mmetsp:Transcript_86096/g.278114  ORF Transcript_86096/g.278114 Transcript_86096/m.278114 type:complete len:892 (-) Transcript_86096:74-2749(-)